MSTWLTEHEFTISGAKQTGIAINVPFLREIKEDFEFRHLLNEVYHCIHESPPPSPRVASEMLARLRDQLETYFALEEFYGFVNHSPDANPAQSNAASKLAREHEQLYLQFNEIVELSEQILYHECSNKIGVNVLGEYLDTFCCALAQHEMEEMEVMMQICNQDLGTGG